MKYIWGTGTDTGKVSGFEALARWSHPVHGMIPPETFLPVMEQAGQIERLGQERCDSGMEPARGHMFEPFGEQDVGLGFQRHFHRGRPGFRDGDKGQGLGCEYQHRLFLPRSPQSCQSPSNPLGINRLWRPMLAMLFSPHNAMVTSISLWITSSAVVTPFCPIAPSP